MTLSLIERALKNLGTGEANEALEELKDVKQRAFPDGENKADILYNFLNQCYIINSSAASDLMNLATYKIYDQLYHENNGNVTYELYERTIHAYYSEIPTRLVELGYDIVSDLYRDNEAYGANDEMRANGQL